MRRREISTGAAGVSSRSPPWLCGAMSASAPADRRPERPPDPARVSGAAGRCYLPCTQDGTGALDLTTSHGIAREPNHFFRDGTRTCLQESR